MRWPGRIPAGKTCAELCTMMDLLPTLARLAGAEVPNDRIIDGHDIRPLMAGEPGARSRYKAFYYYHIEQLQAVRSGRWKLYLPLAGEKRTSSVRLYDLEADLGETTNLAGKHRAVATRLLALAEEAREDIGDVGRPGRNQRPAGFVAEPAPRKLRR